LADDLRAAEVDLDPLWIAEGGGPPGAGVPVDGRRGRGARVLGRGRGGGVVQRGVAAARGAERAVDLELPEGVAVGRGPGGAVQAEVAAGAGDGEGLGAAGAGGGGVDRGPGRGVVRGLDLEGGGVGG